MKKTLSLLFCCCLLTCLFGQRNISGKITDDKGEPLGGATVRAKGGSAGTVSDGLGNFTLQVPTATEAVRVSFTGFGDREIALNDATYYEISLAEGITLGETVVTALGVTRSEKSLGYSVAKVDGEELSKVRDQNFVNQLAGRAAGVTVLGSSGGNLGGSSRILIRGMRSLTGNNQPLFVVDGIPMDNSNFTSNPKQPIAGGNGEVYETERDYGNTIQDLNPDDIAEISILKGQAAAALYGSRGANGVVMVTTKKGGKGKKGIGVSVNSSLTFDKVAVFPKFQNRYGGGVDLLPRGYADNSGYYKTTLVHYKADGSVDETFQSFDLVPIYAVDESSGVRFATSTDEHFQHIAGFTYDNGQAQYAFPDGFGSNADHLNYRNWNSWDAWDTDNYGKSIVWEAGDDPIDFFETGSTSSQNIAFDGGGEHSAFRVSYTRFDQKGILPNAKLQRNTLSFNGSVDLTPRLQAFVGATYVKAKTLGRSGSTYDFRGGFNPGQNFSQWWHTELRFADLKSYENPDGTMRTWNRQSADNPRPQYWDNPYWSRYKNYENDGRDRVFGNAGLSWKLHSWLTLTGRALTDFYTEQREERVAVGSLLAGQYTQDLYRVAETNTDLILRAEHNLGASLSASAFIGGNKLWAKTERNWGATIGGLNVPGIYRLQNSRERPIIQNTTANKEIESLFGGATFGWRNALYLDLTGRQDWSSTLPDGANGYFYPSASVSYIFSEHVDIPKMSFGKMRFGWARTGNDTDPYNLYTTYVPNPNFGSNANFTVNNTLNKLDLLPEQTTSIEAGADLRFFQDRLGLDITVFTGKTTDQIIPLATSAASGFEKQFINAGEVRNKGIELSLHAVPLRLRDFSWETVFNFGKNQNEIVSLLPEDPSITSLPLFQFNTYAEIASVGESYGTIIGTNYLFDQNGNRLVSPNNGAYLVSTAFMPLGHVLPDFTGGFSNTFSWKSLTLNVFIDFRKGGDIYSFTNAAGRYSGLFAETAVGDYRENGAVNPGAVALLDANGQPILESGGDTPTPLDDIYKSTGETNTQSTPYSDKVYAGQIAAQDVYDGSFIKLREMSLGYALPKAWLSRLGVADARVSVVGRNLAFLFKNLPNLDPDLIVSASNIQGNEGGAVPSTRSIGFNLNFKF